MPCTHAADVTVHIDRRAIAARTGHRRWGRGRRRHGRGVREGVNGGDVSYQSAVNFWSGTKRGAVMKSPNIPSMPVDDGGVRHAVDALNTVDAGKRAAAEGASPAAKQMLADVQRGKANARRCNPSTTGVSRMRRCDASIVRPHRLLERRRTRTTPSDPANGGSVSRRAAHRYMLVVAAARSCRSK